MTPHQKAAYEAAIREAVMGAIKTMGLAQFKRTSFFLSNLKEPARKAA